MLENYINLLSEIFTKLRSFIFSEKTLQHSKIKPQYFTRKRKFGFTDVVLFLLAHFPGSLDSELRSYFTAVGKESFISESAISKDRNHLNEFPFKGMFEIVREAYLCFEEKFLSSSQTLIYCGTDGSYLALPNMKALLKTFGGRGAGSKSPTGQMCVIFGSHSHFIYEAALEPLKHTERSLALERLKDLSHYTALSRFCFIFERGYPSLDFFESLEALGTHFIVRSKDKWYGLDALGTGRGYRLFVGDYPYALRAVIIELAGKKRETLITNLFDVDPQDFGVLYYLRWPVEIEFYFIKHVLRLEDFNGYTQNSIMQDFWIALTLSNLASIFCAAANVVITEERKGSHNKYDYQVNFSECVSLLHTGMLSILMSEDEKKRKRCIQSVIDELTNYRTAIRPQRERERGLTRNVFYHFNQKVH